jgi:two-component system OmpR family sensor kinase
VSLRARLVVAVIALTAIGLGAADVATYASLRSFLLDRTDSTLDAAHVGAERRLDGPAGGQGGGRGPRGGGGFGAGPGLFVQTRAANGATVFSTAQSPRFQEERTVPPKLPATITVPATETNGEGERVSYFTVPATTGGGRYRVRASFEPGSTQLLVVAASLHDVDSTLHRLLLIELLVTACVLAALAALGMWVVRLGLRPLEAIGKTAAAIAEGDLSRRVERADDRTEVGRLGLALNAMLGQIETAFKARQASEQRLRRFVADASHELRTPLAAVRAYAELFTRGAESRPDDLARSMGGISRESERMSLLVDDLLLLARLDEGRPLEQDRVALDEVAREAVETARTVDPGRPIELDLEPAAVLGERPRAHACRHAGARLGRARERQRAALRRRLGARDGRGRGGARLRALLPRRPLARPGERRRRARPLDRRGRRRGPRRHGHGERGPGRGIDVPDRPAAAPRALAPGPSRATIPAMSSRVGHPERDRAAVALRRHFVAGRLSADELGERLELALAADSRRDLRRALRTLPQPWQQLDEVVLPTLRETGERVRHTVVVTAMLCLWLSLTAVLLVLFAVVAVAHGATVDLLGFPAVWLVLSALMLRAAAASRRRVSGL